MQAETIFGVSILLNFVFVLLIGFSVIIIKTQLWEFFKIGWKLWRNKTLALVGRISSTGICRLNIEPLKNKIPFGVADRDDVVISKKIYQRMGDISADTLEEKKQKEKELQEKGIHPQKIRLANGTPFIILREGYHQNLDLVNFFKPELDAQQVNDAITQAFEDGFKEGEGNKSNLEKIVTYTMYASLAAVGLILINLILVYMTQSGVDTIITKTLPAIQTQITALTTTTNSPVEFN